MSIRGAFFIKVYLAHIFRYMYRKVIIIYYDLCQSVPHQYQTDTPQDISTLQYTCTCFFLKLFKTSHILNRGITLGLCGKAAKTPNLLHRPMPF